MPLSTNAPFNELGQSMILRDIEQLYMLIQQQSGAAAAGDLNPGGGATVTQAPVSSDAAVSAVFTPYCQALSGSSQSIAVATQTTLLPSAYLDPKSLYSGNGRLIAPEVGVYWFHADVDFSLISTAGVDVNVAMYLASPVNGVGGFASNLDIQYRPTLAGALIIPLSLDFPLEMNAGDYITGDVWINGSALVSQQAYAFRLSLTRIG